MVVEALITAGGAGYLARQAELNPVAFMGLVGRVLPLQVTGADGGRLQVDFRWQDAPETAPTIDATAVVEQTPDEDEPPAITFIGECD